MVTRLLRLDDAPRPADAADALALAICHIWRGCRRTPPGAHGHGSSPSPSLRTEGGPHDRQRARPRSPRSARTARWSRSAASAWRCPARPGRWPGCGWGRSARLATSLVVREDSLTLYGFADDDERALFELLQTANGVGPKLAQTILAVHPPREVRRAVATSDLAALTQVPGIGRKGAERIVIELRDRIGAIDRRDAARLDHRPGVTAVAPWRDQLARALAGLGLQRPRRRARRSTSLAADVGRR